MKASGAKIFDVLQHFYPFLLFLLISCLCWLLARGFWLVIAPPVAPDVMPVPLQMQQTTMAMGNGLDIFAQATPSQPSMPAPDVKIVGLTSANPEHFSFAILNFNGKTKSYKVNDFLENTGFKLASVKSDHIMLADSSGQTARIEFSKPFLLDQRGQNQAKTMLSSQGNTVMLTNQENFSTPQIPNYQDTNHLQNSNAHTPTVSHAIDSAVHQLPESPADYLTQLGVASSDNGYVVTEAMPTGMRDRFGLQIGDKVISVNGQTVGQNPSQDASLFEQVKQSGQAQVQIQRGEQVITLNQSF